MLVTAFIGEKALVAVAVVVVCFRVSLGSEDTNECNYIIINEGAG